jgi:hypothetical protein
MDLIEFLKSVANRNNHEIYSEISGNISFLPAALIQQSSGSIYGLVVELTQQELSLLKKELPKRKQNIQFSAIEGNWYPLYWGKDLTPGARIKAHVQGHKNNGNANLKKYQVLKNKNIKYAALFVSKYELFEAHLHANYQPLLGSSKKGSVAKIVKVMY